MTRAGDAISDTATITPNTLKPASNLAADLRALGHHDQARDLEE